MASSAPVTEPKVSRYDRYFQTEHVTRSLKERAIQGGALTYITRLGNFVIQLVGTVLLARLLLPEDFGLISMVTSLNGILLQLRDIGLSDAVIQAKTLDQRQMSTLFWINVASNSAISLAIVFLSPLIAGFYHEPRLLAITIILSLSFIFYGMSDMHFALLKRNMHFWSITAAQIISNLVSNVVAILLAVRGFGYWALVLKYVVLVVCMVVVAWATCRWRPGLPSRKSGIRHLIFFGANSVGFLVANYFTRNLDKTLVGWKFGATTLGYYDKAFNLYQVPVSQLSMALHQVAVSTLSKLRSDPVEYRRYYLNAVGIIALLGMPICAYLASTSQELILLLLGPKWANTTELFFLLTISGGVHIIYSTQDWLHVSLGRADRWFRWGVFAFLVTVVGYAVGVLISPRAVAIAYTASIFVLTAPALSYAGKPIGLRFRDILASMWKYFVAAAIAGVACRLVLSHALGHWSYVLRLLVGLFVFTPIYLGGVVLLFGSIKPLRNFFSLILTFVRKPLIK